MLIIKSKSISSRTVESTAKPGVNPGNVLQSQSDPIVQANRQRENRLLQTGQFWKTMTAAIRLWPMLPLLNGAWSTSPKMLIYSGISTKSTKPLQFLVISPWATKLHSVHIWIKIQWLISCLHKLLSVALMNQVIFNLDKTCLKLASEVPLRVKERSLHLDPDLAQNHRQRGLH